MPTISKPAGGSFTISGSLKNVGTIDLNIWTAVVLSGPVRIGYTVYPKISIPVGQTVAFQTRTHTIPSDTPAGDYKVYIAVGDNSTAFQEVDTGWIMTVTAPIKQVEAVNVSIS